MFEAYKVGVTLSLTNKVSGALSVIASEFAKTDRAAVKLKATLRELSAAQLGLAGAMVGGVGLIGLKMVQSTVKPAEEYVHQLELAKAAMKDLAPAQAQLQIAQMTAAAWKTTSEVMTTTPAENMKALRELKPVFGDYKDAIAFLPQMQKLDAVLKSTLHGQGGIGAKDVAFTAAKMLELRGVSMNPKEFGTQLDLLARGVIATGGKVTPNMMLQAQKYGGIGATGYSNDFIYGILPTLVQENGGSQTGNSLTSMYRAVVGGRIDKKALKIWEGLGLTEGVAGVTGETAMIHARNAKLYQDSPYKFMSWLDEQLKSKGYNDTVDRQAIIEQLFSNRTAGRIANTMEMQGPRLDKDFNIIGQSGSTNAYGDLTKNDPVTAWSALNAQWETLKTSIGITVVPIILPALQGLTAAFNTLGTFLHENPTLTKALTMTFAGLSGLAVVGGGLLVAGGAFKLITPALTALAGLNLGGAAAGLGALAAALGPIIAIGVAVANSKGIGEFVGGTWADKYNPFSAVERGGEAFGHWLKGNSGSSASWAPPPSPGRSGQQTVVMQVDKRILGQVTIGAAADAASGPQTGPSGFDGRMTPTYSGHTGGW